MKSDKFYNYHFMFQYLVIHVACVSLLHTNLALPELTSFYAL